MYPSYSELSADVILDLDIFNLSSSSDKNKRTATPGGKIAETPDEDDEFVDNSSLFWQPGKRGYYSPRPGKNTPERLNAFRNVGRYSTVVIMLIGVVEYMWEVLLGTWTFENENKKDKFKYV